MGISPVRRGAPAGRLGPSADARAPLPRGTAGVRPLSLALVNGAEIAYDSAGSGPAIVLLHAGVGDRRLWDAQVDAFSSRYRVVRPDLRGFGESPLPGGPFSHVEDVRALLDHLGVERAAVVGNSFGGRIALDFALSHPGRTDALVLVAAALTGYEGSAQLDAFDEEEDELLDAGKLDAAVELNLRTWLDGYGRDAAPVSPETRARVAAMQRQAFETIVSAYERTPPPGPVSWTEPPAATRLHEVAAPTLVVACAYDHPDFRTIAGLLGEGVPGAERATIETAHLPGVEQPDELNELVLGFLRNVRGRLCWRETKEGDMGFLDKLLGRDKNAAQDVGDTAKDPGDQPKDVVSGDEGLSETGQAEERLDNVRDQALRDEGRMP